MAAFTSIAAVGLSIEAMLDRRLKAAFDADNTTFRRRPSAQLVTTDQFNRNQPGTAGAVEDGTVSIYCYRVDINRTMRPPWAAVSHVDGRIHLPLDLHFLMTAWESDAEAELRLIGFTLLALETTPILSGALLHPVGRWAAGETVQLVSEELVNEDVLRTFETLPTDFRLSVSYVARVVRVEADVEPTHPDVLTVISGLTPTSMRP